jgi:hypothetical protein
MQVTLVQCSPRLVGEELRKSHVFVSGIKGSKRSHEKMEDAERSGRPTSHRTDEISKSAESGAFI